METIGIIGWGNFGQVLAKLFAREPENYSVQVYSHDPHEGQMFKSLETVLSSDYVFPCIPISTLKNFLEEQGGLLQNLSNSGKQITFVEVCSVMEQPVAWCQEFLPKNIGIIASHPLFGPSSTLDGTTFANLKMVLHPEHDLFQKYQALKDFYQRQQLIITELTPSEHDQFIAYSQAYTFLVGKLGIKLGIANTPIDTKWFGLLMEIQTMVKNDTDQLFRDMLSYNQYATKMFKEFVITAKQLKAEYLSNSPTSAL